MLLKIILDLKQTASNCLRCVIGNIWDPSYVSTSQCHNAVSLEHHLITNINDQHGYPLIKLTSKHHSQSSSLDSSELSGV